MNANMFARRLVKLRELAGLTQAGLADRIGVARETVYRWESGKHATPHKRMRDICRALGVTEEQDRKSTRLNSSHVKISYAVFCLKKKKKKKERDSSI